MPTMYDDVNLDLIPKDAEAVAGYVNGKYQTFPQLASRFPNAKRVSIAVTVEADADCLDIEKGDALISQAPQWVRRQLVRGVKKPIVYCSLSDAQHVLDVLYVYRIPRRKVRLWTAHYTHAPHRCSPACGFGLKTMADATQYTNVAKGRSLDASLVTQAFLDPGLKAAAQRQALRTWIFVKLAEEYSWGWIKKQPKYKLWRRLGGK